MKITSVKVIAAIHATFGAQTRLFMGRLDYALPPRLGRCKIDERRKQAHGGDPVLRRFVLLFALLCFCSALQAAAPPASATSAGQPTAVAQTLPNLFDAEDAAQTHCPRDVVVWLNIPSGIYHYKGERWYGRTKHGAYVCEKEAIAAGDRASLNGQ